MLLPKQHKAYCDFYDAVRDESVLDCKTTIIIGLTAAMTSGCDPRVEYYLGVARDNRISNKEISAIQGIVMAVAAEKINATMRRIQEEMKD